MNYTDESLRPIFQSPFNMETWTNLMINLFQVTAIKDSPERLDNTPDNTEGYYLGYKDTDDHYRIGFFHYKVNGNIKRKRVGLRKLVKSFTNPNWGFFDAALAVFEGNDDWRLSLISDIKGEETAPKRFTYVFGDPHGAYNTPVSRFKLLQETGVTFHNLMDTFSVEALTREFYNELFAWYQWALSPEANVTFPNNTSIEDDDKEQLDVKIIRLITRLMFVWFIKQKNLVPDNLFNKASLRNIIKDFNPDSPSDGSYYNAILQNLFFATLNRAILDDDGQPRQFAHRDGKDAKTLYRYADRFNISEDDAVKLFASVPFLNGGLFDCLDKTKTLDGVEKAFNYDGFSRNNSRFNDGRYKYIAVVPNRLFFHKERGLLSIFRRYNFTIEENSHNEQQVALDPELLGKVFENLLGAYNPETRETARNESGSFYTPREIVSFMVDESLMAYLGNSNTVKRLFSDDFEKAKNHEEDYRQIAQKLKNIKILDPACGSGAFPMGMLTRITELLQKIEPEKNVYELKLWLIEHCLYGSDIQCIAAQITKLRFFISLVCNCEKDPSKDNFGIPTLPNLETKFVTADSLVAMHRQTAQLRIANPDILKLKNELTTVRHQHFAAKTASEKARLRAQDARLRSQLIKLLETEGSFSTADAQQIAAWNPYDQNASAPFFDPEWMFGLSEGFDIVIGNPPYIQLQNNNGALADKYSACGYNTFARTGDIYCLFYERGVQLLKPRGHLCFISSNKWMRAGYGERIRRFFNENTDPITLIDFAGVRVFDSATVDVNILLLAKDKNRHSTVCAVTSRDTTQEVKSNLRAFVEQHHSTCSFNSSNSWTILSPIEQSIRQKIERAGTPLKDWDIQIYRGILTGCNEAFIISDDKRNEILRNCADNDERQRTEQLIRPILRGRDIKRYGYDWKGLWIINTHNGVKSTHDNIPRIRIEDYPAVKEHLDRYWDKIYKRADKGDTPYNLRNCAYWQDFEKPKIMYSEIVQSPQFYLDDKGEFVPEATAFILTGEHLHYLTDFLNSDVSAYIFKTFYAGGGLGEHGVRYKKAFFEKMPIPKPHEDIKSVDDAAIYSLYGFTKEEIRYIEEHKKASSPIP